MSRRPPADAVALDLEVPFHDVDSLHIVWHGHYMKYLELGRTAFMRAHQLDVSDVVGLGYRMVIIETRVRHTSPLRYAERFRVRTWLDESTHRIRLRYEVWSLTHDRRVARAHTDMATTHVDGRLLLETPDAIRRRLLA